MKNPATTKKIPLAYFLTFTTYGTWLHGDHRFSVDRSHNVIDTPRIPPNKPLREIRKSTLQSHPIALDHNKRNIVLTSIVQYANLKNFRLYAAHVRSNHVHVLIKANINSDRLLSQIKSSTTLLLRKHYSNYKNKKIWTRHGSTRYIWYENSMYSIMKYIIEDQGEKMACFYEKWFDDDEM